MKKAEANAALKDWKAGLLKRYNENMASYNEQCATLAANGTRKKHWPKKPSHPLRGRNSNHHSIFHLLTYLLPPLATLLPLLMSS